MIATHNRTGLGMDNGQKEVSEHHIILANNFYDHFWLFEIDLSQGKFKPSFLSSRLICE